MSQTIVLQVKQTIAFMKSCALEKGCIYSHSETTFSLTAYAVTIYLFESKNSSK